MGTRFAAVLVLALAALPSAAAADRAVTIGSAGFTPKDVTIAAGDSVTWRNTDSHFHQVNFEKAPCKLQIPADASGSCTFRAGGKFNYRDATMPGGSFRGSVTVTGPKSSVTLAPGRRTASFGAPVTLSGVISSQESGEFVAVSAQGCGKATFAQLGSAATTAGGRWSFTVKPGLNTVYRARWRATDSSTATVGVSPKLRLTKLRSRFTVRVTAAQGFNGKLVLLQRYRTVTKRWATLRRVKLGAAKPPAAGTIVTSASFRSSVRRGWRLRALMPRAQTGVCYLAAASNALRVR